MAGVSMASKSYRPPGIPSAAHPPNTACGRRAPWRDDDRIDEIKRDALRHRYVDFAAASEIGQAESAGETDACEGYADQQRFHGSRRCNALRCRGNDRGSLYLRRDNCRLKRRVQRPALLSVDR
jgi:hypothetical protein